MHTCIHSFPCKDRRCQARLNSDPAVTFLRLRKGGGGGGPDELGVPRRPAVESTSKCSMPPAHSRQPPARPVLLGVGTGTTSTSAAGSGLDAYADHPFRHGRAVGQAGRDRRVWLRKCSSTVPKAPKEGEGPWIRATLMRLQRLGAAMPSRRPDAHVHGTFSARLEPWSNHDEGIFHRRSGTFLPPNIPPSSN